jgi:hypothetical protein
VKIIIVPAIFMKYIIIILLAVFSQVSVFSQGNLQFGINFGDDPPPHTAGNPESGARLTYDLFYAILYLSDATPSSGSILEKLSDGSFTTIFQFTNLVYATYSGGGPALDYEGSWQLTDTQIDNLLAGDWYARVDYNNISYLGQISAVPEPSTIPLLFGGSVAVSVRLFVRRSRPNQ